MSDFFIAEGFGALEDGTHAAGGAQLLGEQWNSVTGPFVIEDRGDGRKWLKRSTTAAVVLRTQSYSGTLINFSFRILRTTNEVCWLLRAHSGGFKSFDLVVDSTGRLMVDTYVWGTYPYGSVVRRSPPIPLGVETHVELECKLASSPNGYQKFYFNGELVASFTGIGLGASTFAQWNFQDAIPTGWKIGDVAVHAPLASPVGDMGIYYCPVNASGSDADFTPSAGDNEDCVDEIGPDDDTTYNESDGTAGHRDSLAFDGTIPDTIYTVMAHVRARKTGASAGTLHAGIVHSGSEDQGAAYALNTAFRNLRHFVDDCPSTSSPWTPTQVGAAEVSYEVGT